MATRRARPHAAADEPSDLFKQATRQSNDTPNCAPCFASFAREAPEGQRAQSLPGCSLRVLTEMWEVQVPALRKCFDHAPVVLSLPVPLAPARAVPAGQPAQSVGPSRRVRWCAPRQPRYVRAVQSCGAVRALLDRCMV